MTKKVIFPLKKQNEILAKVKKLVMPISKNKNVIRILIEGSAARRKLGKYVEEYHGRMHSDIDVLIVADKKIKLPKKFIENYNLPLIIKKRTKHICYRYIYKHKLEGKMEIHVHLFDIKRHNKKLAIKCGLNVNYPVSKNKTIMIYGVKR